MATRSLRDKGVPFGASQGGRNTPDALTERWVVEGGDLFSRRVRRQPLALNLGRSICIITCLRVMGEVLGSSVSCLWEPFGYSKYTFYLLYPSHILFHLEPLNSKDPDTALKLQRLCTLDVRCV